MQHKFASVYEVMSYKDDDERSEDIQEHEKFYIPWSFDYRGRAYPIPAFLTPQDHRLW